MEVAKGIVSLNNDFNVHDEAFFCCKRVCSPCCISQHQPPEVVLSCECGMQVKCSSSLQELCYITHIRTPHLEGAGMFIQPNACKIHVVNM